MVPPLSRRRVLALLAASGAALAPATTRAQTPPLRIATAVGDSYASPYYALDGGFFAKQGIDADVTLFTNGGAVMQATAGNAEDIGLADAIQIANAVARGIPFTFFAGGGLYRSDAPTTVLCVAKNGAIKKPKDLEGATIAMLALKSVTEIAVRRWMESVHIDANKVKLFELPGADIPGALTRGTVAAGVLVEPVLTAALNAGDVVPFAKPFDAVAKTFYISSWFTTRDWLTANAATARKLTTAIYDAARWADAHPDLSAPILTKYSKLDPDRVKSMTRVTMSTALDPALLQPVLDAAAAYSLIPAPVDAGRLITKV
jgi:NitT/TauT family transport system substrate-binding protein